MQEHTEAVVQELAGAKQSIQVQGYSFTLRGVDTQVFLERSQRTEKYSSADFVAHEGIPTFIENTVPALLVPPTWVVP